MSSDRPFGRPLPGAPLACVVCGAALRRSAIDAVRMASAVAADAVGATRAFCDAPTCRFVASRQASMRPVQFDFWLAQQVRNASDRAALVRADADELARKRAGEAAENEARWAAIERVRDDERVAAPADGREARVALPSGPRRLGNLPGSRRGRYRDHLTRLITEALASADVPQVAPDAPTADAAATRTARTARTPATSRRWPASSAPSAQAAAAAPAARRPT